MGLLDDIKRDAGNNKTIIQSSEAQKLSGILNKLFYLDKNIALETNFVKSVMTRGQDDQERIGLHASELIVSDSKFCLRKQVLSLVYRQLQGEQIPVNLKRIFEEGNAIHEKWQRLFIRGGYSYPSMLDVTQFNEEYKISFTPDIICKVPEFYKGKMVGELKSVNTFQFKKMIKHPSAGKQLQWYMFLTGIHKGFVLSEDKNTQEFKIEVYDYDESVVAPFIKRAEDIKYYYDRLIKHKKLIKRPTDANSPDCKRCQKCALKNACWRINGGGVKI